MIPALVLASAFGAGWLAVVVAIRRSRRRRQTGAHFDRFLRALADADRAPP